MTTITISGYLFIFLLIIFLAMGFAWGRWIVFKNSGIGIIKQTNFIPSRSIYARDFNKESVYKMMAAKLISQRKVTVVTSDIDKSIKRIAKAAKLNEADIEKKPISGYTWLVSLK